MGGVVSGAALPALADRVVSATVGPYVTSLVLGGYWGVAFAFFAMYHLLFADTNGWAPATNRTLRGDEFTNYQSDVGTAHAYYIILPALALAHALLGWFHGQVAFSPRLFPHHAWPLGHLFDTRATHRAGDESKPERAGGLTAAYIAAMAVVGVLASLGSWLPYEMVLLFAPDGGTGLYAPIVGCAAPPVAVALFIGLPWLMFGPSAHVYARPGSTRLDGAAFGKAWGAGIALAAVFAAPPALVAYFFRDFDWTWTASAITAGVAGIAAGVVGIGFCAGREEDVDGGLKLTAKVSALSGLFQRV